MNIRKPKMGIADVKHSPWQGALIDNDSDTPHEFKFKVGYNEEGEMYCETEVTVQGKSVTLGMPDMMALVKELVQCLFFTTVIPPSAVPEQFRGNLQVSQHWATLQAQNILPYMLASMMTPTMVGSTPFQVDFDYLPNLSSSNLVGIDGKKRTQWDGSFRPVLKMREILGGPPEYVGEGSEAG